MPAVEITSTPLTPSTRLRTAMRLTRWLADHGSDPAHVVVVFRAAEPMTYFVGGAPLTHYDGAGPEQKRAGWGAVVCHVHPDRDTDYQAALADEIRQALRPDTDHCLVRFEPTEPRRVFYAVSDRMTNSVPHTDNQAREDHAHD